MARYLTKTVQVMYATNTTWSVNNKPCTHTTNLKLLTYKTCAIKKSKHIHVHKTHINIQPQWKKPRKEKTLTKIMFLQLVQCN
jgi:hypothetical protein